MLCPVCNVSLVMSDRQGIEIDYCPQCRGVWLDRGELDKIIERSVGTMAPPPRPEQPRYEQPRYEQQRPYPQQGHGHYKKKHKSIWGEIFDFD